MEWYAWLLVGLLFIFLVAAIGYVEDKCDKLKKRVDAGIDKLNELDDLVIDYARNVTVYCELNETEIKQIRERLNDLDEKLIKANTDIKNDNTGSKYACKTLGNLIGQMERQRQREVEKEIQLARNLQGLSEVINTALSRLDSTDVALNRIRQERMEVLARVDQLDRELHDMKTNTLSLREALREALG